jgi:bacterioferritin-associated ferredoxin
MYLCHCKAVTEEQVHQAVAQGVRSLSDLSIRFGVGSECGQCHAAVEACLRACLPGAAPDPTLQAVPAVATAAASTPAAAEAAPARAAWFAIDL